MNDSPKITAADAIEALDNLDDYARMGVGVEPKGDVTVLLQFILQNCDKSELRDVETIQHLNFFASTYNIVI